MAALTPQHELLLVGDSLLAEMTWRRVALVEAGLGPTWSVINAATSGHTAAQSLRQAPALARIAPTAVVVSLGTNDASPDRGITVADFEDALEAVLSSFAAARRLLLMPPGLHGTHVEPYRSAAASVARRAGATTIDGRALAHDVIATGEAAVVEDDVHLTDAMYAALAGELRAALR